MPCESSTNRKNVTSFTGEVFPSPFPAKSIAIFIFLFSSGQKPRGAGERTAWLVPPQFGTEGSDAGRPLQGKSAAGPPGGTAPQRLAAGDRPRRKITNGSGVR